MHEECLTLWLRTKGSSKCELCGHVFSFEPVLAPNAPHDISLSDIASWIMVKTARWAPAVLRFALAVVVWLGFVATATAWMFRSVWVNSLTQISETVLVQTTFSSILHDIQTGVIVCAAIVVSSVIIACVRELLRMHEHERNQQMEIAQVNDDLDPVAPNGPFGDAEGAAFDPIIDDADEVPLPQWI